MQSPCDRMRLETVREYLCWTHRVITSILSQVTHALHTVPHKIPCIQRVFVQAVNHTPYVIYDVIQH